MRRLRIRIPIDAVDVVGLAGAACLVYGIGRIYRPAGWIVAGLLLMACFVLLAYAQRREDLRNGRNHNP